MSIRQGSIQWICRVQCATSDQLDFLPEECPDYLVDAITAHSAAEQAANDFMMDCGIEHASVTVKVEMWRAADEKIQGVRPDVYGNATIRYEPEYVACFPSTRLQTEGAINRLCGAISRNQQIQNFDQFRGIGLQHIAARTIVGSIRLIESAWRVGQLARAVQITRKFYRNLHYDVWSRNEVTGIDFKDCGKRDPGSTDDLERGPQL
jgi:hypothetical protein